MQNQLYKPVLDKTPTEEYELTITGCDTASRKGFRNTQYAATK